MARHYHHRHNRHHHHRRHHRHNPFGVRGTVISDSLFTAVGALGIPFVTSMFNLSGWADIGATFGVSALAPMVAKVAGLGSGQAEEVMKGGIAASIIKAAHQLGLSQRLGMGLYAPSWFGVPTASSQYLTAYGANYLPARRGQGTIFFPGPNGQLVPATVAPGPGGVPTAVPALPPHQTATGSSGMGYHRFRSRYQGNY